MSIFLNIVKHGGRFEDAFDLWMAFFRDPDGYMLALHGEMPKGFAPQSS